MQAGSNRIGSRGEKMDLSSITYRKVSFGHRTGHDACLRSCAMKELKIKPEELALKTDYEIKELFIDKGFLPVVISGYSEDDETVYLIKKDILEKSIKLIR